MRYQGNALTVWFIPRNHYEGGITIPLDQQPIVKDKWYAEGIMAYSCATMEDEVAVSHAQILFEGRIQELYPDPEIQGGKIALVAVNNNIVRKPPNSFDRMHASLMKQVAYNQRVLSAEKEIAGINCDIRDFLIQMRATPEEPIIVCVNTGPSPKRHEQHLGGQLWIQGSRQMTATNIQFDGMPNDGVSVCLSAVAKAVEWTHTLEDDFKKRPTQRLIVYPPSLNYLAEVLSAGDSDPDPVAEHSIAYNRIFAACARYESSPVFYCSDQPELMPGGVAEKVSKWMNASDQVSVGSRVQVLEDGSDVCNSESDSDNEDHGSVLKDAYKDIQTNSNGDPTHSSHKMTTEQANAARAASHQALCSVPPEPVYERNVTPMNSDNEDEVPMSIDQERSLGWGKRKAGVLPKMNSQGSESTHGMTTRSKAKNANGAGCLRPGVGSESTDTCVAKGNPS
jgi:hypothetical protein